MSSTINICSGKTHTEIIVTESIQTGDSGNVRLGYMSLITHTVTGEMV